MTFIAAPRSAVSAMSAATPMSLTAAAGALEAHARLRAETADFAADLIEEALAQDVRGALVLGADGSVEEATWPGTLLGIYPDIDVSDRETVLAPGDAVVFYTDGVVEEGESADEEDASMHGAATASDEPAEPKPRNVSAVVHVKRGDAAAGLRDADVVVLALIHI